MSQVNVRSRRWMLLSAGILVGFSASCRQVTQAPNLINSSPRLLKAADRAFRHFAQGIASGDFQPLLEMISDDCVARLPLAEFRASTPDKAAIEAFLHHQYRDQPIQAVVVPVSVINNANTVGYEFQIKGSLDSQPVETQNTVFFDMQNDRIVGFREYLGN